MTPEERAVIKAAKAWARKANADTVAELLLAVQALKVSRQPEQGPEPIPCSVPSTTGRMLCALPVGHDPDETLTWHDFASTADGPEVWQFTYRPHEGYAADGSRRVWSTWVERRKP